MIQLNNVYNMNCLEGMKLIEDNSIDSIVTDPPYELGFMGKKWDNTGISCNVEMWKEALRILKPGGHLLAFGGTRTYHRMTCAIEDAGFEIRDQIQWLYGSGFPKSMNISKQIDKQAGTEKIVGKGKAGKTALGQSSGYNKTYNPHEFNITEPNSIDAVQWDGWGTALKPANEPICVARKPLSEKTVIDNVLKWGTGGINIDDCRIETTDNLNGGAYSGGERSEGEWKDQSGFKNDKLDIYKQPDGRFPANIILDEEAGKLLDIQSGVRKAGGKVKGSELSTTGQNGIYGHFDRVENQPFNDVGGASRFFYCAKSSKSDRGIGNTHPTVKPQMLMQYLIKLVTPIGGIVLDPFLGSGSTVVAAINLGKETSVSFDYVGFELDEGYYNIACNRIEDAVKVKKNRNENDVKNDDDEDE